MRGEGEVKLLFVKMENLSKCRTEWNYQDGCINNSRHWSRPVTCLLLLTRKPKSVWLLTENLTHDFACEQAIPKTFVLKEALHLNICLTIEIAVSPLGTGVSRGLCLFVCFCFSCLDTL